MDKFKKSSYDIFKPFVKFGELIGTVWSKISPVLGIMWNALGKFFDGLKIKMENLTGTDVKNFFDMMLSGGFIVAVSKFLKQTEKISSNFGQVLGSVKDTLKTYQKEIKANIIQKIAIAVGILAASLIALTFVDKDKITGALVSVGTLLVLVTGSLIAMSRLMGDKNLTVKMPLTLVGLAVSIGILVKAISTIASIKGDDGFGALKGMFAVISLMTMLVLSAITITNYDIDAKKVAATGLALIPLTIAIRLLANAIAKMGSLPLPQLIQGGVALTALMGVLAIFVRLTQDGFGKIDKTFIARSNADMINMGIGFIALSASMLLFAKAISNLGKIPLGQLQQGGVALAGILVYLGVLSYMAKECWVLLKL
jgi:hypothetical protein